MSKESYIEYYENLQKDDGRIGTEVQTTTITVEANGDYIDVINFLDKVTTGGKNVICNSLTFDIAENISINAYVNPSVRMVASLIFVGLPEIKSYCDIPKTEALSPYSFPQNIIDGSYRMSGGLFGVFGIK